MGTNGGLKRGIGSCGVTMRSTSTEEELIYSYSAEQCKHGYLHSTREEIRAALAAEGIIQIYNELFGSAPQNIRFICDNKSALNDVREARSLRNGGLRDPLGTEAELLYKLDRLRMLNVNIKRSFEWVQSHADDVSENELTVAQRVNNRADQLATLGRTRALENLIPVTPKQISRYNDHAYN